MAGRCSVFLDGGYLDKVLRLDFPGRRIDYEKLVNAMAVPDEMLRAYYYHCMPYRSNPQTDEERERYSRMHRFTTKLAYLPRFEIRLGRLVRRGTTDEGEPLFVQKRVDCMVGVDMALLAGKRHVTRIALLTGDSDLIPAVEAIKREAVLVTLWHGTTGGRTPPSRELFECCDERCEINDQFISPLIR